MGGGIYLGRGDGGLVAMSEKDYASEDLLQGLLAEHPDLLAGDQIDSSDPRRWVLVSREMPLASEEDGSLRWSVDHLFLDQDAIPTIMEVKRSTDTRRRREVVGQMLDYAANAVVHWPVEALRQRFEGSNEDRERILADLLDGPEADPEEFWGKTKTNLQAGKVRLVFVANRIPDELRRVVEFLAHLCRGLDGLCEYYGVARQNLMESLSADQKDAVRAILAEAFEKIREIKNAAESAGKGSASDAFNAMEGKVSNAANTKRKFGLALADLLERFEMPDVEIVDEHFRANPLPHGRYSSWASAPGFRRRGLEGRVDDHQPPTRCYGAHSPASPRVRRRIPPYHRTGT